MINQKAKFFVGLFIATGIGLAVVTIILLGMNRFLEKGRFYAVYFNESVQGLKIDSPVKYRGVTIGHIERIALAPDSELIEVVLKIEADITLEENMVAQQKAVGITGSKFIELDLMDGSTDSSSPDLKFPTEYRVLASRPSNISELFRSVDDIVKKLNTLDIVNISDSLKTTLNSLDQSLHDFDAKGISNDIKTSLNIINKSFDQKRWGKLITGLEINVIALEKVINSADGLMQKTSDILGQTGTEISGISNHLTVVGQNLEKTTGNLDNLMEQISAHPSQLLFGEPPPERKLGDVNE
ncbi:MAG: MlaD family protein [Candidatus Scalindua rubra]|uniref:ABC-transporter component n=1 Tax=Candidatus Scalindua brodae TaxID=237368 RepID=A0A0B0ENV4_9BACT|nr:MAG: ABC-transporter component [Candidatus Scalindua brodae]MBZ0109292.1 MlaD family protein [Candidatus Scalindua rubra]TWU36791.1 paraquat-inducible protein B [Candidatus Brocadiaceae bacterium S225]